MIPDRIKKLIKDADRENAEIQQKFWREVEAEADKYGVTIEYYLAEFY